MGAGSRMVLWLFLFILSRQTSGNEKTLGCHTSSRNTGGARTAVGVLASVAVSASDGLAVGVAVGVAVGLAVGVAVGVP